MHGASGIGYNPHMGVRNCSEWVKYFKGEFLIDGTVTNEGAENKNWVAKLSIFKYVFKFLNVISW